MIKDKNHKEMIRQMRSGASRLEREGEYWTLEEREDLKRMYFDGVGITEIAMILQRTELAVTQQIEKQKQEFFMSMEQEPRRRRSKKRLDCLCCRCQMREDCPVIQALRQFQEGE